MDFWQEIAFVVICCHQGSVNIAIHANSVHGYSKSIYFWDPRISVLEQSASSVRHRQCCIHLSGVDLKIGGEGNKLEFIAPFFLLKVRGGV